MPVAIGFRVWTIALCSFDLFEQRCVETNGHMQLDSAAHGIGLLLFCCHSRLTSYAFIDTSVNWLLYYRKIFQLPPLRTRGFESRVYYSSCTFDHAEVLPLNHTLHLAFLKLFYHEWCMAVETHTQANRATMHGCIGGQTRVAAKR